MREDLLVLLEPGVDGVPIEPDRLAKLLERRRFVAERGTDDVTASGANAEGAAVATARRVDDGAVRHEQLRTNVVDRDVVRRVVGLLPDKERPCRVGDELARDVGADALRAVLDADTAAL